MPDRATASDHYVIISADNHVGAAPPDYRPFVDLEHLDTFDRWVEQSAPLVTSGFRARITQQVEDGWCNWDGRGVAAVDEIHDIGREVGSAARRVAVMEQQGYVGAVLYSGAVAECPMPFTEPGAFGAPADLRWASAWAYNRWLADFCGQFPEQLAGITYVPEWDDLDRAMEMVRWGADHGLRGGIQLPQWSLDLPGLHEAPWDPLWGLCEERGLPLNVHGGYGMDTRIYGTPSRTTAMFSFYEASSSTRPLFILMLGGVFDRFPGTKLVFSEQGADWVPQNLYRINRALHLPLDDYLRNTLELTPREYWDRNCAVCGTFMAPNEAEQRHEIGVGSLMWGSDLPHPEGTYPFDRESLRFTFHDVPADELRQILGDNPARIYGFDLDALQPIADRVGPTVEELAAPLTADQTPSGFRRFSVRPELDRDLVTAGA